MSRASLLVAIGFGGSVGASAHRQRGVSAPVAIAGGYFEASGVVHVPGSSTVLFVDDNTHHEMLLMQLSADGRQKGSATRIPVPAEVTDLEGMTSDDRYFYAVGSQSKVTGVEGDGLIRFTFDAATRRVTGVERVGRLKAWLAANVDELHGTERKLGDHVLNIEGLAWDPVRKRLLLGLRAPVVDGAALIVPIAWSIPRGDLPVRTCARTARRFECGSAAPASAASSMTSGLEPSG